MHRMAAAATPDGSPAACSAEYSGPATIVNSGTAGSARCLFGMTIAGCGADSVQSGLVFEAGLNASFAYCRGRATVFLNSGSEGVPRTPLKLTGILGACRQIEGREEVVRADTDHIDEVRDVEAFGEELDVPPLADTQPLRQP